MKKRPMMLLEVLIAFALVALCAIPLLTPHFAMLRAQQQFRKEIMLDHTVNLLYGLMLQQLYLNQVPLPWNGEEPKPNEITPEMLRAIGINPATFPYKGFYVLTPKQHKPSTPAPYSVWLFDLTFLFKSADPREKQHNYHYDVFLVRKLANS